MATHLLKLIIDTPLPLAFRKIIPTLHEAASPGPEREPPSPPRWSNAVWSLSERYRALSGAGTAVLEVGVHKRQSGCRQGNVNNSFVVLVLSSFTAPLVLIEANILPIEQKG